MCAYCEVALAETPKSWARGPLVLDCLLGNSESKSGVVSYIRLDFLSGVALPNHRPYLVASGVPLFFALARI